METPDSLPGFLQSSAIQSSEETSTVAPDSVLKNQSHQKNRMVQETPEPDNHLPGKNLAEEIMQSHRLLARVHEKEIQDVQTRLKEMSEAIAEVRNFGAQTLPNVLGHLEEVTADQHKLITSWRGKHQDFLDGFDQQSKVFMEQSSESLKKQLQVLSEEVLKRHQQVLKQFSEQWSKEIQVMNAQVQKIHGNLEHDLNEISEVIQRHNRTWQDKTTKLYGGVLVLSVSGAFAGTIAALFLSKLIH